MIGVVSVCAERRDLVILSVYAYGYSAMLDACIDRHRKDVLDLLRLGRRCDIPVLRFSAQQRIAHAAAHRIGLVPAAVQLVNYVLDCFRQMHDCTIPSLYGGCS